MPPSSEPSPAELNGPLEASTPDSDNELTGLDLTGLTVAGLTRRRVTFLAAAFLAAWVVILFARQVGQSADATLRLHDLDDGNQALTAQVASLERELALIQRQEYIRQAARGYGLGRGREVPFTLGPGAPPLPANAPGSASVRLGASSDSQSPLESWLSLLFGPAS